MLKSGIPLPKALETLSIGSDRVAEMAACVRSVLGTADLERAGIEAGLGIIDVEILAAGSQSGRMEEACQRLKDYYAHLAAARRKMISLSMYPLFLIHLAAVLLSIPRAILDGSPWAWVVSVIVILAPVYVVILLCAGITIALRAAAKGSVVLDRSIQRLPLIGGLFREAALARFCMVLSLGIRSADGILSSLKRAGRASGSACIASAAVETDRRVRGGEEFSRSLAATKAFPDELARGFLVAESSGRLDAEMQRWGEVYSERFFFRLENASVWIPRLLYLGISLGVGLQILSLVSAVTGAFSQVLTIE